MTSPIDFLPNDAGARRLQSRLREFDALVCGDEPDAHGTPHEPEEREQVLAQCAKLASTQVWSVRMADKDKDGYTDAKDRFLISRPSQDAACPLWHELPHWLRSNCAIQHLLLDLTTLSGSSIFQLHAAAVRAKNLRLSYTYTTPKRYPQVDRPDAIPPVITRTIKQPYGYRSFAQEHLREGARRHVIVLGFDRHRPNKFIEHYQWPLANVFAVLGDPAYVDGGVPQAQLSLGSVYGELAKLGRVRTINPKLLWDRDRESGIVDVLTELGGGVASIDIVPLGPKPTLLGCIVFWHSLSEAKQEQTRLLYDFPVSRQVRTEGVGVTWLYPDIVVPAQ